MLWPGAVRATIRHSHFGAEMSSLMKRLVRVVAGAWSTPCCVLERIFDRRESAQLGRIVRLFGRTSLSKVQKVFRNSWAVALLGSHEAHLSFRQPIEANFDASGNLECGQAMVVPACHRSFPTLGQLLAHAIINRRLGSTLPFR